MGIGNTMNDNGQDQETKQLNLFRQVFGKADGSSDLSNVLMFWDSIPKYSVGLRQQSRMRDKSGKLPTVTHTFHYQGEECRVEITPAYIQDPTGEDIAYYPAATEELIEDILRKFLLDASLGSMVEGQGNEPQTLVRFSLKMIQRELRRIGKTRSIREIKHALDVMVKSTLKIKRGKNRAHSDSILSSLTMVSREDLETDPDAMCCAYFARPITQAIHSLAFRQLSYGRMMQHDSQLARWLFRRLSYLYINASLTNTHTIKFSEINTESGLLHHKRKLDRVKAMRRALSELVDSNTLYNFKENHELSGRTIKDYVFTLFPHHDFVSMMKAANARQKHIREAAAAGRIGSHMRRHI